MGSQDWQEEPEKPGYPARTLIERGALRVTHEGQERREAVPGQAVGDDGPGLDCQEARGSQESHWGPTRAPAQWLSDFPGWGTSEPLSPPLSPRHTLSSPSCLEGSWKSQAEASDPEDQGVCCELGE